MGWASVRGANAAGSRLTERRRDHTHARRPVQTPGLQIYHQEWGCDRVTRGDCQVLGKAGAVASLSAPLARVLVSSNTRLRTWGSPIL